MSEWSEASFRFLVRDTTAALLVVDLRGRVCFANEAAQSLVGRPDVDGLELTDLVPTPQEAVLGMYLQSVAAGATQRSVYLSPMRVDWAGRRRWVDVSGRALREVPGFRGLVLAVRDVTEFVDREQELTRHAFTDTLTGLTNRASLIQGLRQAVAASSHGSLLMIDLDRFKQVNDTFGHERGDQLLVEVARRMRRLAPADATVARFGGDEFGVLLPGTPPDQAEVLAQDLLAAIAEPITLAGVRVVLTASTGVAGLAGHSVDEVFRAADLAMYQAKAQGRGQVQVFGPGTRSWAQRRRSMDEELERLRQDNARYREEARVDVGTGLPNRRRLLEDLTALEAHARRHQRPFAVVFVDLDRFGALNKHRGDDRGDLTLSQVATVLTAACRSGDTLYRKGGEELVALLPDTDLDAALGLAERLRAALETAALPHGGHPDSPIVTASIGVAASHPDDRADAHTVLARAGHQMLEAKRTGRNRVSALA